MTANKRPETPPSPSAHNVEEPKMVCCPKCGSSDTGGDGEWSFCRSCCLNWRTLGEQGAERTKEAEATEIDVLVEALDHLSGICTCDRLTVPIPEGGVMAPGPHTKWCVSVIARTAIKRHRSENGSKSDSVSGFLQTPKTDAEARDGWSGDAECVSADFARQLEREIGNARQATERALQRVIDFAEWGWTIIANASGGDWEKETSDWREAAEKYRDQFHNEIRKLTPFFKPKAPSAACGPELSETGNEQLAREIAEHLQILYGYQVELNDLIPAILEKLEEWTISVPPAPSVERQPKPEGERGWLIEKGSAHAPKYLCVTGTRFDWTVRSESGLRFSRKIDAEMLGKHFLLTGTVDRIAEHAWESTTAISGQSEGETWWEVRTDETGASWLAWICQKDGKIVCEALPWHPKTLTILNVVCDAHNATLSGQESKLIENIWKIIADREHPEPETAAFVPRESLASTLRTLLMAAGYEWEKESKPSATLSGDTKQKNLEERDAP